MKSLTIAGLLLLFFSIGQSQDNWEEFKNEKKGYYSSLVSSGVKNFSVLISSSEYIRFIQDKADSTFFYPLKVIWIKSEGIYYVMQPFPPSLVDSTKQQLAGKVEELKQIFVGALSDWQQFSLLTPFHDIPEDATVRFGQDTVGISFDIKEEDKVFTIKKMFSRSGELAKIIWYGEGLKIVTYPYYKEIQNNWVCQGWRTQFHQGGEITSGISVVLGLEKLQDYYLPSRIKIIAQSKAEPDRRSVVQLFLKNYVFNEDFELVTEQSEETEAK